MNVTLDFTFQSGYIQIKTINAYLQGSYLTLHSNLVIFKSAYTGDLITFHILYIPIWLYSNRVVLKNTIEPIFFTFQSGYIQI